MLLLSLLAACQCNEPTTTYYTYTDTTDAVTTDKKYKKYEQSGGPTGDTSVPTECAGTLACWRFELPASKEGVEDLSGRGHLLTLGGAAEIVGPGPMLPGGVPNTGVLSLAGGADVAWLEVADTELAEFPSGLTLEALLRPSEKLFAADNQGDRVRTVVWLTDHLFSLQLSQDDKGANEIVARVGFDGEGAGTCGVEARGSFTRKKEGACASVTYDADGTLRVFLNAVEVASATVPKGCTTPAGVGPAAKGARFQIGADSTVSDAKADHTWRGQIDEVRIRSGAVAAKDLVCALATSR